MFLCIISFILGFLVSPVLEWVTNYFYDEVKVWIGTSVLIYAGIYVGGILL